MKTYTNFTEVIQELTVREQHRKLVTYNLALFLDMEWGVTDELPHEYVTIGTQWLMTKFAFAQMCKKLAYVIGKPVTGNYLWAHGDVLSHAVPIHLASQNEAAMNKHIARNTRTNSTEDFTNNVILNVHNENIVTAFLSTNYHGVSNVKSVEKLAEIIEDSGMTPVDIRVKTYDDFFDTIDVSVIFEEFVDGGNFYGAGITLRNSQNGLFGLLVAPIVKSNTCDNSIIEYMASYNRHTNGVEEFFDSAVSRVPELVGLAVTMYNNSRNLRQLTVRNMDTAIDTVIAQLALPHSTKPVFIEGLVSEFDEPNSLYSLISAITYVSQTLDNPQKELRMNNIAGNIANTFGNYAKGYEVSLGEIKLLL